MKNLNENNSLENINILHDKLCMALVGDAYKKVLMTEQKDNLQQSLSMLINSNSCRNRFRDAACTDENAYMSLALWPPVTRDYKLQIVIITKEGWSKCESMIDYFLSNMPNDFFLTIISGEADPTITPIHPRFELHVIQGKNVPELKILIPTFLKESEWVSCLEDHASPAPTWITETQAALANMQPETMAFTGTFTNFTSTSNWSWASFLFNSLNHWHPCASAQLTGSVGTTFFRRDLLGSSPTSFYHFEHYIFARKMQVIDKIQVNHTQHLSCFSAIYHNFIVAIASGASRRLISLKPIQDIHNHNKEVILEKVIHFQKPLARHASYSELPSGTSYRVGIIAICHCIGYTIGAIFGPLGSYEQIE